MGKGTKRLLLILGIVFIFGSAIAFLLVENKDGKFWLAYCSGVAALCAVGFGSWKTSTDTNQPSSHVFATVSGIYLAAVALAIYLFYIRLPAPVAIHAAIQLLLLGAYLVVILVALSAHTYITDQGKAVRKQVLKARMDVERLTQLIEAADDLPEESRQEAKEILREVEDKLRYSDPMQSEETAQQAGEVETALDNLEQAMDALQGGQTDLAGLRQQAKLAVRKIDAYNRAKKLMK